MKPIRWGSPPPAATLEDWLRGNAELGETPMQLPPAEPNNVKKEKRVPEAGGKE